MNSRLFSCFNPQESTCTSPLLAKDSSLPQKDRIHNRPCIDTTMAKLAILEERQHQQQPFSPINLEVVQYSDNSIALKQPNNVGTDSEKPCMHGLELVLNTCNESTTIVKNTTQETSLDQEENSFGEQGDDCSSETNVIVTTDEILSKPLYKLQKDVRFIGKHVKNSKTMITWHFQYGELKNNAVEHCISLAWSKYSSKVSIHMDGIEIHSSKVIQSARNPPYFVHRWNTCEGTMNVEVLAAQKTNSGLVLWNHDLTVNGELFENFLDLCDRNESELTW